MGRDYPSLFIALCRLAADCTDDADDPIVRGIRIIAAKGSGHLVARAGIDGIQQWLPALESAKVFAEEVDDIVPMFRADSGGVRGDDDMGESPERAPRIQRFAFENIQNGAAKPAILKSGDKSRLIDDFPARNIDENGAAIKQGKLIRAYQTIRFRNRRGADNQHIAPVQRFVQTVRAEDTLDETREDSTARHHSSGHFVSNAALVEQPASNGIAGQEPEDHPSRARLSEQPECPGSW